jgi:hypothetical protein
MSKKTLILSVVCLFVLSSCQFFWKEQSEFIPEKPVTAFDVSLDLDKNYIANFRLDGFTNSGEESNYVVEKKNLKDAYNAGDRSLNLIRAYIYLSTLEGDFVMKSTLEDELCKLYADICSVSIVQASVAGLVRDSLWKPLSWVVIEILGTKHTTQTDTQWKYSPTTSCIYWKHDDWYKKNRNRWWYP